MLASTADLYKVQKHYLIYRTTSNRLSNAATSVIKPAVTFGSSKESIFNSFSLLLIKYYFRYFISLTTHCTLGPPITSIRGTVQCGSVTDKVLKKTVHLQIAILLLDYFTKSGTTSMWPRIVQLYTV